VDQNEPYYPVPNPENQAIYEQYKREADKLDNIYFVGRLANYKYFNMDQAFKNALDLFSELEEGDDQLESRPATMISP
jgi:UDP-galactopyranose mutase